ncbi:hypothetical protein AVEN_269535-1 [Araneus ventricosus]|uniref:Uncharacterized protein n=1 Tax=Araneus ventricosus TaxID=182803 RepID=A0A4Y2CBV9_ARAVE|nr:hypothetical protein AVEN_269535-1 [Araneus ventricosus]
MQKTRLVPGSSKYGDKKKKGAYRPAEGSDNMEGGNGKSPKDTVAKNCFIKFKVPEFLILENIVTNMESRFPAMLVLWLGREFYRGKYGMTGSIQARTPDLGDHLGDKVGDFGDEIGDLKGAGIF